MITFVGQAPSRNTDGKPPFTGRSGERLAELCNMTHTKFLSSFNLTNLIKRWPGKYGEGDAFPMKKARANAAEINIENKTVILVGKNVANAFGIDAEYFEKTKRGSAVVYVIPHPSGVNRWWNDPENARRARIFMRSFSKPRP